MRRIRTTLGVLEKPGSIVAEILADSSTTDATTIDPSSSSAAAVREDDHNGRSGIDWHNRHEIVATAKENIGLISEDRVLYPEMNTGEVPRMFR